MACAEAPNPNAQTNADESVSLDIVLNILSPDILQLKFLPIAMIASFPQHRQVWRS